MKNQNMLSKRGMASTSSKCRVSYGHNNSQNVSSKGKGAPPNTVTVAPSPNSVEEDVSSMPHIKIIDNSRLLPKYSAAVARSIDDILPVEDLDTVQLELETLLSTVALRYRVLKSEYESLEKDEKRAMDRRSKHVEKQPTSPGKRKRVEESRKPKLVQFKMTKKASQSDASPSQSQHTDDSMEALPQNQNQQQKDQKISLPKNDTPNKFWLSVEPYCMPLTNEDLRLLDDLLEQYSGPLVPPIPELGPHYTTTWASDDTKEEQDNSNTNSSCKSRLKQNNSESIGILKRGEKLMGEGVTGPLTQRLVSALMDENLLGEEGSPPNSNSSLENTNTTNSSLQTLSLMKNGISIEKRVSKELIEQGILDPEDLTNPEEDEIHSEIKRVLAELSAIAEYNGTELKRLQLAAKAELQRLEIKRKLDLVDQEIVEAYKKVMAAKVKRRPLSKEEQDEIYRLTTEQKRLSEQLETIPTPGPKIKE